MFSGQPTHRVHGTFLGLALSTSFARLCVRGTCKFSARRGYLGNASPHPTAAKPRRDAGDSVKTPIPAQQQWPLGSDSVPRP
ncbi:hypothetical protein DEU56DRAFT_337433 [Suillus clintonianus]|uniref:uncharacterized protein n=1 Tax=Suillus clintonianus TaxID=1904413 RepID=UPI001B8692AC|nr:uncharacterized protein DEU56DRAFT_337433 [Suillus clintonianus]KAG2138528.1 hypothetical protein DEU56DRAFT_337433 [Suillus clintonianus]